MAAIIKYKMADVNSKFSTSLFCLIEPMKMPIAMIWVATNSIGQFPSIIKQPLIKFKMAAVILTILN